MSADRAARALLAVALAGHATLVVLNVAWPGWRPVDLDGERNLPACFQAGLLAAASLAALDALRLETRLLGRLGRPRGWPAAGWLAVAGGLAFLALDEALQIHEELNSDAVAAALPATSPLLGTVVWVVLALPAIVAAVAGLIAWLAARARAHPGLVRWAGSGVALWLAALVLEGTAKPFFIPRELYALEVLLEETAEGLGTTCILYGIWRYRWQLRAWLARWPVAVVPPLAVRWRVAVTIGALALVAPAAVVAAAVVLNPAARHKAAGDAHLEAGRPDLAVDAYRMAAREAPRWRRPWEKLGIAELRRDNLDGAAEAFATAERLAPGSGTPPNYLGAVLLRQGRYVEAAAAFRRAVALGPAHATAHRNLGIALRYLGREQEADEAFRRAEALGLSRLGISVLRVSVPADLPLVYLADPALAAALAHTRAGRLDAAVATYRRAADADPGLAAAHLGLANELLRWAAGQRLVRGHPALRVPEAEIEPVRPSVLFTYWVGEPDGVFTETEATVEAQHLDVPAAGAIHEAEARYRRALDLRAGAPAYLGLAILAREAGRLDEASVHLAAARALDSRLPALAALPASALR